MNPDLEHRLIRDGIRHERLAKAQKVKLLTQWTRVFPAVVASARHGAFREDVSSDTAADEPYAALPVCDFYILPDDASDMPSYACFSARPPELSALVSDTSTKCDELIVVDWKFRWTAVFVNHMMQVGKHFSRKSD